MEVKNIKAFGTEAAEAPLNQLNINRRNPTPHDVEIEILFCGVCHSDLHTARNEWHGTTYPCVPGHEIVGRIVSVGNHVSKFKVGDIAAVGCLVDSCRDASIAKKVWNNIAYRVLRRLIIHRINTWTHKPTAAIQKALW